MIGGYIRGYIRGYIGFLGVIRGYIRDCIRGCSRSDAAMIKVVRNCICGYAAMRLKSKNFKIDTLIFLYKLLYKNPRMCCTGLDTGGKPVMFLMQTK